MKLLIRSIAVLVGIIFFWFLSLPTIQAATLSIQNTVNGSVATVTADSNYGGAITSFNYRGVQYINSKDKGLDLQSASAYDNYGECFNPTEAGNNDGVSSQLLSWSNQGGVLTTSNYMAFWLEPGESDGICPAASSAVNTTVMSNYIFQKSVSFGVNGIPNTLNYQVTFNVPEARSSASYEALTGYFLEKQGAVQTNFNGFLTYDPHTSTVSGMVLTSSGCPPNVTCITLNTPVLVTTGDGKNAMGVMGMYSPLSSVSYAVQWLGKLSTSKWSCDYGGGPIPAGSAYTFNCDVAFGTVDEVISAFRAMSGGSSNTLIPVLRFYNGLTGGHDHFLTLSYSEAASTSGYKSYAFEQTAFGVYASPQDSGMVPLYRCLWAQANDHFVSLASNCEGKNYEGMYGYVSSYSRPGYIPIYRFYNSSLHDHLATTNYSEGVAAGYSLESILGYAATSN